MQFNPEVRRAIRALQKHLSFTRNPSVVNNDGSVTIQGRHKNIEFQCDVHLTSPDPRIEIISLYADDGKGTGKGNGAVVRTAVENAARTLNLPKVSVYKGARLYWGVKAGYSRTGKFPRLFEKHL